VFKSSKFNKWQHLNFLQEHRNIEVQVQASAPITTSPLQAEALALLLAAKIAQLLQAATRSVAADSTLLAIRASLACFFKTTDDLRSEVFHISREINGIAHNDAHQVLSSATKPVFSCFGSADRNMLCPVTSILSTLSLQGFVLHAVFYYRAEYIDSLCAFPCSKIK
jgi:hypothetical protein